VSEHAISEVAELATATRGLAEMVKTRVRRAYRDADELRRLTARLEHAAALLEEKAAEAAADTLEGTRA